MYFLYEARKIYKSKFIFIVIVFLLLLNFFMILTQTKEITTDNLYTARRKVADEIEGPLTKEKVNFITQNYKDLKEAVEGGGFDTEYDETRYTGYVYGDYNLFREWSEELERIYRYPKNNFALEEALHNSIAVYKMADNKEKLAIQEKLLRSVQTRSINALYDYTSIQKYISYDTSSLFIVLFILIISTLIFSEDWEMTDFLKTTVNGRNRIHIAKWEFILAASSLFAFVMYLMDLLVFVLLLNIRGMNTQLYFIDEYRFINLDCSIGGYVFIVLIVKILAMAIFSLICAALTRLIKKSFYSLPTCLFVAIILIQLTNYEKSSLSLLNPLNMVKLREIIKCPTYITFAGNSLPDSSVMIIINLVFFVILSMTILKKRKKQ